MKLAAAALLLMLGACSAFGPLGGATPAPTGLSPETQACARQAETDPAVRDAFTRSLGNQRFVGEDQDQIEAIKRTSTIACLRARGKIQPGRVERPDDAP